MSKNKLQKFALLATYPNAYQNFDGSNPSLVDCNGTAVDLKGKWKSQHFKNDNPITLELACGGGEYTVALAEKYPNRNFIGIDVKGARIWKGATKAIEKGLDNAAFCRTRIEQLHYFFAEKEISEIWITFPDPFLKKERRRLTAPRYLALYQKLLVKDGLIHLKTDDPTLYEFSLEMCEQEGCRITYQNDDIYAGALFNPDLEVKTYYEQMHLADQKTIKYLQFRLKS